MSLVNISLTLIIIISSAFIHEIGHYIPAKIFNSELKIIFSFKTLWYTKINKTIGLNRFQDAITTFAGPLLQTIFLFLLTILSEKFTGLRLSEFLLFVIGMSTLVPNKYSENDAFFIMNCLSNDVERKIYRLLIFLLFLTMLIYEVVNFKGIIVSDNLALLCIVFVFYYNSISSILVDIVIRVKFRRAEW